MNCSCCGVDFEDIKPTAQWMRDGALICLGCCFKPMSKTQDMTAFRDMVNGESGSAKVATTSDA